LLRVESDDLIRLIGVTGEHFRRTDIRASGPEQPACLL
jgi:hypothetical protein